MVKLILMELECLMAVMAVMVVYMADMAVMVDMVDINIPDTITKTEDMLHIVHTLVLIKISNQANLKLMLSCQQFVHGWKCL